MNILSVATGGYISGDLPQSVMSDGYLEILRINITSVSSGSGDNVYEEHKAYTDRQMRVLADDEEICFLTGLLVGILQ
jgi:hypothetical protein